MTGLSQDQVEKRDAIQKTATIWGAVAGVAAGLLALWLLGSQGGALRFGGAAVIALAAGFLVYRASFNSGAKTAKCEKCGAAFSRSRTDRTETPAGSEDKEQRETQDDGSVKVTTWVEDRFGVVDTYTCAKCGDATTNTYQTTRRRDEETVVEPAPAGPAGKGAFEANETAKPAAPKPVGPGKGAWAGDTAAPEKDADKGSWGTADTPDKPGAPKKPGGSKGSWG